MIQLKRCIPVILFLLPLYSFSQAGATVFYLNPKWSPDGKSVAFTSNKEGKFAVYIISSKGDNNKRITDLQYDSGLPAWSRDGKSIVYYRTLANGTLKLFSNDTSGNKEKQISFEGSVDYAAAVSIKGKIAFNRRDSVSSLNHDVYTIDISGDGLQKITDSQYDYSAPDWSPDGKQLVMIRTPAMTKPFSASTAAEIKAIRSKNEIVLMNADGSAVKNITNDTFPNRCPSFSADGKYVYFMTQTDAGMSVYSYSLSDQHITYIHSPSGSTNNFHISADNRHMMYASQRSGKYGLYIFDLETKTERVLLQELSNVK